MIPEFIKYEKEWKTFVTNSYSQKLSSLSLKLKLNALLLALKLDKMNLDEAAKEVYIFCKEHEKLVEKDLEAVFNLSPVQKK